MPVVGFLGLWSLTRSLGVGMALESMCSFRKEYSCFDGGGWLLEIGWHLGQLLLEWLG